MKTLEQLGISPAPWRQEANGYGTLDVLGSDDSLVVAYENPINRNDQENRRLIAASPELYDALQSLVEYIDRECVPCGETACELMYYAHNVLAKASGESEVADER